MNWYRFDLHLHTPASECYRQTGVSYLDILKKAEEKRLDIIAFADHNTVRGYAELLSEVRDLELLESLGRLQGKEKENLLEYRRLLRKILVLPAVEFTATFGFHILGVFSDETSVRAIEHLLLNMGIPPTRIDVGTGEVGATVDVLTVYRMMREAGAIVIAAHANSTHGVALQGLNFGGQTKIAFTQDPNLHALEVTDLESTRRQRTSEFFNGSRPEYPRRMHIIQGSDCHRLDDDPTDRTQFGVGGRAMEVLLPNLSYAALKEVFEGTDFTRMRPYRAAREPFDHVQAAREAGPSIVQSFHEGMGRRGGRLHAVLRDIVGFANTNGGTVYVGVSARASVAPKGVDRPEEAIGILRNDIQRRIAPALDVEITSLKSKGKPILRVSVPSGPSKPYTLDGSKIYVRQETETSLAVRDEIVQIISRQTADTKATAKDDGNHQEAVAPTFRVAPPRTGVEVVSIEERKGVRYHALRDLRNRSLVTDVTKESARRLWRYAITEHDKTLRQTPTIKWSGDLGVSKSYKRGNRMKYNLAQLDASGASHYYYGVTEEGLHGEWKPLVGSNGAAVAEEATAEE
ncbi:MAG: transcriptional regulator [Anaerolineae bacterium]|nr:transcriptional regulator [Anaerolineae bacterium]